MKMFRFGKFKELSLREKLRKEWSRRQSIVRLPERLGAGACAPSEYLAICAIMKNEGRYLLEWLEFHRLVGVERFYLYDNGSTDNTVDLLRPWLDQDIVRLMPWPQFVADANPQYLAYAHAAALTAGRTRWLGCIDLDEFLFPVEAGDLREVLRGLEPADSLGVFRREFPFCGHEARPEGPVIANYHLVRPVAPLDRVKYKSIVNPAKVRAVRSAHGFVLADDCVFLNERLDPIRKDAKGRFEVHAAQLRVNHYFTKSRQEFRDKLARGNVTHRPDWEEKITRQVAKLDADATETDVTIQRFLPDLTARL